MNEGSPDQILLFAPKLLGETLACRLNQANQEINVLTSVSQLTNSPKLIIWSVETPEMPSLIQLELTQLQERWKPSPLLLLLPADIRINPQELIQFDCAGLLQDPDLDSLTNAISTIIDGGRIVRLKESSKQSSSSIQGPLGLGQWLLLSGLQQINTELSKTDAFLSSSTQSNLSRAVLFGRKRELIAAKSLLKMIWTKDGTTNQIKDSNLSTEYTSKNSEYTTDLLIKNKSSEELIEVIRGRLKNSIKNGLTNSSGILLAIESLNESKKNGLFINLLDQLPELFNDLRNTPTLEISSSQTWQDLQIQVRTNALRNMVGTYKRIQKDSYSTNLSEELLSLVDLTNNDIELPSPKSIIDPLLKNQPIVIEGQHLSADEPRAILHIELLLSNWLIRNAEIISAEILEVCSSWPELRPYLLKQNLIPTRELERLRNQLNSQNRWLELIRRPINLYESKRILYQIINSSIKQTTITETRDHELENLNWLQQQVVLLIEARDALAPQIQTLIRRTGDLMAILLTQVIGRAIGLVGRGIAQGMGRTLSRG